MSKNLVYVIFNLYVIAYLVALFSKVIPFLSFLSYFLFILVYLICFFVNFQKLSLVLPILFLLLFSIINSNLYYLNDNVRLIGNVLIVGLPIGNKFEIKPIYTWTLIILFLFQILDYFFVFFPRDLEVKNNAYGLWNAGNELAIFLLILILYSNKLKMKIIVVLAGYFSMVKFAILIPLLSILKKVTVKNIFLILISIFVASYTVIYSNAELKYLLSNENIDYVDLITSFRYSRFMNELPLIFNRNSEVKYFEMDLIDLYLASGFPGIIALWYLYYFTWVKLKIPSNRILLLGLITYSFLFGHVLMSTSFGLLILSSKYLKNEHSKKYL